jgi:hypothetical protein
MDKTVKLGVGERFKLIELLPREGDRVTAKVLRGMLDKLDFSAEDIQKYKIENVILEDGKQQVRWNSKEEAELIFNDVELEIVGRKVKELEKEKKISVDLLALFDKLGV